MCSIMQIFKKTATYSNSYMNCSAPDLMLQFKAWLRHLLKDCLCQQYFMHQDLHRMCLEDFRAFFVFSMGRIFLEGSLDFAVGL